MAPATPRAFIAIVRDGSFAGVVCETEHDAEVALKALRKGATWSGSDTLPDENDLTLFLKSQPTESVIIDTRKAPSRGASSRTMKRQYTRPYIAHASIAPSCAMAQWDGDKVRVWTHSQSIYFLRTDLALVLKLPVENITVEHMEGAGCYGHNAADDVALDAVLLARAADGRPVRVQWSREGEMSQGPFGPAMVVEIEADLDANDEIVDWRHAIWSNGHTSRPVGKAPPALLAATELEDPFPRRISDNQRQANGGGADRNAIPLYDFPSWQVDYHRLLVMPVRSSALRSLGAHANVFAIELFSMSWRRSAARTRLDSGYAICPTSGQRTSSVPSRVAQTGNRRNGRDAATASVSRATRTQAPIAPSSPRSRGTKKSG